MDEIQKIPPSEPVYNTKYVYVYESTPEVVYVGYTPGYMWSYPWYGVPIYGTGYPTRLTGDRAATTRIRRRGACTSPITRTRAGAWASRTRSGS